ncbi:histidine triad (HIT) protein [Desulfarculus baarsii DSM 2075]|uniref:Histidine triad (HIT) protein n=1 Tax=Desulfarculus baarsii (strain ATCC 33931 / DSM 2075 / LMG 7858 / VKM B-1802 / 2st14) TaxID=644282 RepID=E1QGH3_DESB2|nr:HIT domain-containing protein [Desulfarculus baarsii]ADK84666.1 histidine triad (HIT) protein [Desulfarculus baarsii DSM 2075]
MEVLWAPWRMSYILGNDKADGCIFCLATDGVGADNLVLGVGRSTLAMMNKYPYNNGHLLIAPKRHVAAIDELTEEESADLMANLALAKKALQTLMNPEGYNVGLNLGRVAGAGIEEHLHFHIVPRWGGDTNFMTVLGDVRSVPEHIEATCEKLRPFFKNIR